ncbi:hypothetical protein SprV_0200723800 [Sparganum proliferum]
MCASPSSVSRSIRVTRCSQQNLLNFKIDESIVESSHYRLAVGEKLSSVDIRAFGRKWLRRFEAILADLKNPCASALPENVFEDVQQRINATTKDARLKKRVGLQEKLQSLLRPTNERAGLESVQLASALPEDRRADMRSCATGILRQKRRQQTLPVDEAQGLQSLKSDHNIVVVSADKGGDTVIMDRIDYVNKANGIFSDIAAYTLFVEDPTKKQAAAIRKKVNELARLKVISPDDSKLMTLSDPLIARAYGLPKCGHQFNWDGTEVVATANTKRAREFLEAQYSNAGSISRHVDLDAHYEGLSSRLTVPCPNATSTTANPATRSPIDPPSTLSSSTGIRNCSASPLPLCSEIHHDSVTSPLIGQ